ncbi:PREDICTED: solute carrier family 52, riboflavin transporter, member 3-B-like, partial [Rhagoletis zephyria]|uniref:solute carrier family 52, riboflavin transporter, member 3-B-like n=1 Tax=Rhagoletis zephyria TaxID=28612 RepID=UPI00081137E1
MTPYLVGEGLSGFIPSMFALIQGVGENRKECLELTSSADIALNATAVGSVVNASAPFREQLANLTTTLQVLDTDQLERSASSASSLIEPIFSVEVFFLSLFSTLLISYIGFCTLQLLPEAKQEMANARKRQQLKANAKKLKVYKKVVYEERMMEEAAAAAAAAETSEENGVVGPMINSDDFDCIPLDDENEKEEVIIFGEKDSDDDSFGNRRFNRINSVASEGATEQFPYSALPYGVEVLHYIVVLSGLAYPTGCFFGMLVEAKSVRLINLLTAIGTTLALYILACALMSPSPPLVDSPVGGILMVLCWIAYVGILSYSKTMITLWICDYNSRKGMFWVGMNQQFGAATGALLNFILINYSRLY